MIYFLFTRLIFLLVLANSFPLDVSPASQLYIKEHPNRRKRTNVFDDDNSLLTQDNSENKLGPADPAANVIDSSGLASSQDTSFPLFTDSEDPRSGSVDLEDPLARDNSQLVADCSSGKDYPWKRGVPSLEQKACPAYEKPSAHLSGTPQNPQEPNEEKISLKNGEGTSAFDELYCKKSLENPTQIHWMKCGGPRIGNYATPSAVLNCIPGRSYFYIEPPSPQPDLFV